MLTAFQQVEDDLAALKILADETTVTDKAVKAAEEALAISTYQYKVGIVNYLQVITSQAAALAAERSAVDLLARRMVSACSSFRLWEEDGIATRFPPPAR